MEKHLDPYNIHASVFLNQRIMHDSILECLNQPDVTIVCGKRYELTKTFTSDIGVMAYSSRSSNTIKMVYTKTKRLIFVKLRLVNFSFLSHIPLQTMKCFEIHKPQLDKYQPFCFSIHHLDSIARSTRICHHTDVGSKSFGELISFSTNDGYFGLVQAFSDTVVHYSLIKKDGCVNIIRIEMFFYSVL